MRSSSRSRRTDRFLRTALILVALLAGGFPSGAQQTDETKPEPDSAQPQALVERSEVRLALLEAVVVDRKGRHLRGVDRELFELYSEGKRVPIVTFDEIDIVADLPKLKVLEEEPGEESQAEPTPKPEETVTTSPPEPATDPAVDEDRRQIDARQSGPRWFVMVFDGYNNVSPLRMSQIRRAAKKWISENLRPQDMVAVYELNPYLASIIGFTDNRPALYRAIDKARIFPGTSIAEELLEQKLDGGDRLSKDKLKESLINVSNFGQDLLRAERDQYYTNLTSVADVLGGLDGTRAVMLFSGGFPLTRARTTAARGGFTVRFKRMLEQMERRGIRVFTYDIGEEGGFTDASESTNYRVALDELGLGKEWLDTLQIGIQITGNNAHQEVLSVIGNETGGRFWRGRDYASGLQAADDDLSHYYLIGYRPKDVKVTAKKQRYAPLTLKVNQKGARVISRKGSHLPDLRQRPREAEIVANAARAAKKPAAAAGAGNRLELDCHPVFYPGPGGTTLVVLPIQVAGPVPSVEMGGGQSALDIQLTVYATRDGQTIERGSRDVRLRFPATAARSFDNGLQLRDAMLLPPATDLELHAEVKLRGLGKTGKWSGSLTVPSRRPENFGLTDLTLLHPAAGTAQVYDVFRRGEAVLGTEPPQAMRDPLGDGKGRPPVYIQGSFSKDLPLLAQVQVIAPPPRTAALESPLRMDWELVPENGGDPLAPPVNYRRLQLDEGGGMLDVMVDLNLAQIQPGEYTLRITAENLVSRQEDRRSFPISITP